MKIINTGARIKQLSQKLNIDEQIAYKELLKVLELLENKKMDKHFLLNETDKNVLVVNRQDVQYIRDGCDKLSFISLADYFKVDVGTINWVLNRLFEKRAIDEQMLRYYMEVKNKPSIKAWFEPSKVTVGEEATLNIEAFSPSEINQPKLTVSQLKGVEVEYEPKMPLRMLRGKRLEKYKFRGMKHGNYKISVKLEGIIEGVKFGPEEFATASLEIKSLPPEIHVDARSENIPAMYRKDCTIKLVLYNKGLGEAKNVEIRGLERHQEFDVLSSTKIGNIVPHSKIEYPLSMKPKKSGEYAFEKLILTYEDLEGKPFESTIPSFKVDVTTPKPKVKTEIVAPPIVRSKQIFSITVNISNIGEGEAKNISFKLPIEPRFILSGYVDCSIPKLGKRETEEFMISLQAPEKNEIRIHNFDMQFQDMEGTRMTRECEGTVIPIRTVPIPDQKELTEWPFNPDNVIGEKFYIVREVGDGAFAIVYLAKDTVLKEERALKALKADFVSDSTFVDEFIQEARISINLQHQNIVRVFDVDKETYADKIYPYIEMEYMKGGTLEDALLPGKPMNLINCLNIMQDLCSALIYAHQQKVIHCDIKPSNIFYDKEKEAWKLGDFGLAKIVQKGETLSRSGGTLMYMAPEVRKGKVSKKSDVYSLGVVFKEMLTGDPTGDITRLEKKHKRVDLAMLRTLIDMIEKMTDKTPDERPSLRRVWKVVKWSRSDKWFKF